MNIEVYNFKNNRELTFLKMLECQSLIDQNLESNGGTLRQEDLLLQPHDWQYLVRAEIDEIPVGFSLVRKSKEDKHNIGESEYYYISVIAVDKQVQHNGIGTELLNKTLSLSLELPIVASCRKDNEVSKNFLSKLMKGYEETRRYYRFIDPKTYTEKFSKETKKR